MPDRNSEEWERRRIREAYRNLHGCRTPKNFTLPSYVDVHTDTSPEVSSNSQENVKTRRKLKYVDDRAAVAESDEEIQSIGSESDSFVVPGISLSTSTSISD